MGASCPEAVASQASELRQINTCSRLAMSRRLTCVGSGHGGTGLRGASAWQAAPWLQLGLVVESLEVLIISCVDCVV
jgi:hypothetical protein